MLLLDGLAILSAFITIFVDKVEGQTFRYCTIKHFEHLPISQSVSSSIILALQFKHFTGGKTANGSSPLVQWYHQQRKEIKKSTAKKRSPLAFTTRTCRYNYVHACAMSKWRTEDFSGLITYLQLASPNF